MNHDARPIPLPDPVPRVAVVVLNWNNHVASRRCLESLKRITYPEAIVYLLDNGSTDDSMDRIEAEFKDTGFRLHRNGRNLGFSAGCNRGIELALADGCRYVLLLNNDCIVSDPEFLERGVSLAESSPRIGIVGGKILFWPDTHLIWSTGGFIHFWGGERHIGHGEPDRGQFDRIERRTFISGALMLIKRDVIDAIGPLPEAYFFGKEEWEYSTRAIRAGFTLLYHPGFRVFHEASISHDGGDATYAYNGTLSKILYKRRNMTSAQYRLWRLIYGAYLYVFFPVKYALRRSSYLQAVSPEVIRNASLEAFRDSERVEKITGEMLQHFREKHVLDRASKEASEVR